MPSDDRQGIPSVEVAGRVGVEALRRRDEVGPATGHAAALRDRTQRTANLATWSDAGPVIIRWDYGAYPLPSPSGSARPCPARLLRRPGAPGAPGHGADPAGAERPAAARETSTMKDADLEAILTEVRRCGCSVTTGVVVPVTHPYDDATQ